MQTIIKLNSTGMHLITPDAFFEAVKHVFNIEDSDRLRFYWENIIYRTDESIGNSSLELQQISYMHPSDKVEKLLFDYDVGCIEVNPDSPNNKFFNAIAKYLFGDDNKKREFDQIYIQRPVQLAEFDNDINKINQYICGKEISGQLILA